MTHEMKHIARQTKTETISMKIITVVTLFFLPGTFISVCLFVFLSRRVSYKSIPHMNRDFANCKVKLRPHCSTVQEQTKLMGERNQSQISLTNPPDFHEHRHCKMARRKQSLPARCLERLAIFKSAFHGHHTWTLGRPSSLRPAQRELE